MNRIRFFPVALLLLSTLACLHRSGGTGTAVTPWERVHTYNAALAEANNAVERGAEVAVSSSLLSVQQAAPIINWTGQVAILHQQITAILQQGNATAANVDSIRAMVGVIKGSLAAIPPSSLGFKNPRTQATFQQDVESIGNLADALLLAIEAATPAAAPAPTSASFVRLASMQFGGAL